jgi:AcrR family transcriptional regulator
VIRHDPVQVRARRTVDKIVDAVRVVLRDSDVGRDRFTTKQVAQVAGCRSGTVYRYFPDRLATLEYVWPDRADSHLPVD